MERTVYEIIKRKLEKKNADGARSSSGSAFTPTPIPAYESKRWQRTDISKQYARHKWLERAEAWDVECDRVACEAHLAAIKEMNERHARLGAKLLAIGQKRVDSMSDADISHLSARDVKALVDCGFNVERTARGEAASIVKAENKNEHTIKRNELLNYTPEQLVALQQLLSSLTFDAPPIEGVLLA